MIDQELKKFVKESLKEDIKNGDHTTLACIDKNNTSTAKIVSKENGTIAGVKLAEIIFKEVDKNLKITSFYNDGDDINKKDVILKVSGSSHAILNAERLVLNCMQQMSAIATKTRKIVGLISLTNAKILDTRKTTPLNRQVQKWAVKIGGGFNHRFGLYDMIMIKDNHIDFCNGITNAIRKTKSYIAKNNLNLDIIIETRDISEVKEVLEEGGIRRILLDNFNYKDTKEAVKIIDHQYETESSGGINEENILEYAKCGIDYISLGALTHSIQNFDISLLAE